MANSAVAKQETANVRMPRPRKEDENTAERVNPEEQHLVLNHLERKEVPASLAAALGANVALKRSGKPKKELEVEDPLLPLDQEFRTREVLQIWLAKSLLGR